MQEMKAIIVPGNGGDEPGDRWRPWVTSELEKFGVKTINVESPDPVLARKSVWLLFLKELGADERTILIGHSSGAEAAMRYAETNKVFGSVLISACHTDLSNENEKLSGYYDSPWNWQAIKANQGWIVQFASTNDPFIPIAEAREVHERLGTEYFEYNDRGHFIDGTTFPELIEVFKKKLD